MQDKRPSGWALEAETLFQWIFSQLLPAQLDPRKQGDAIAMLNF
ncbi:MAG TPA: hypothetical protein V6D34_17140 [Candidatus Sericytochromatia bacterium]